MRENFRKRCDIVKIMSIKKEGGFLVFPRGEQYYIYNIN